MTIAFEPERRSSLVTSFAAGTVLAAVLLYAPRHPALAEDTQDPKPQLEQIEKDIEAAKTHRAELERQAAAAAAEVKRLREKAVDLASDIREQEERLSVLESKIALLQDQEKELTAALKERMARMSDSLAALQRLSHRPPLAMIASPAPPSETVKSALTLRAVVPAIERQASDLSDEISTLADLRADIRAEQGERNVQLAALTDNKAEIDALMQERSRAEAQLNAKAKAEAERVQKLAAKAKDLRELLATLQREKEKREAENRLPPFEGERSFSQAKGHLPWPALGEFVQRFGERDIGGLETRGIVLETRPDAQVVAPYDGTIVFAGPFRGYGLLVIIDHGEGYHSLLSGMMRIDAVVGQGVLTGEPIGQMGGESAGKDGTKLYVELRYQGSPINPMPWLAASERKVNG